MIRNTFVVFSTNLMPRKKQEKGKVMPWLHGGCARQRNVTLIILKICGILQRKNVFIANQAYASAYVFQCSYATPRNRHKIEFLTTNAGFKVSQWYGTYMNNDISCPLCNNNKVHHTISTD